MKLYRVKRKFKEEQYFLADDIDHIKKIIPKESHIKIEEVNKIFDINKEKYIYFNDFKKDD